MKTVKLKGELREALGKKSSKKTRNSENIPCVVYGNGLENVHFFVEEREIRSLIYTPDIYLIDLDVAGKKVKCILRDVQYHPVTDKVLHADFFSIVEDRAVQIYIPINITGNSVGVRAGGKIQILTRKLSVSALPKDLPASLAVDISNLEIGKTIFVRDLSYNKLTILTPPSIAICRIKATRATREKAGDDDKKDSKKK